MIDRAEVVVIGSGALGASVAYHLTALGQEGVVLLDRFAIASQTTARAAGMTLQIRRDPRMMRLAMLSVEKLTRFEEETGEPLAYVQGGSVQMARTDADAERVYSNIKTGQAAGLDIHEITASDLRQLTPIAQPDGVQAMWYTPSDLYLEPGHLPRGYARAAERRGATVLPFTEVRSIEISDGAVTKIVTDRGDISTPVVVDAAGAWSQLVAEQAGFRLPLMPMRHQLFITEPIPGAEAGQPICRVSDARIYVRPEQGGLMFGGYETEPTLFDPHELPSDFQMGELELDLPRLRGLADLVLEQFPVLEDVAIIEHRGGLPTMTPDGRHLIGPVPGLEGFFAATGCAIDGLGPSPAIGQLLAELIVTGRSSIPLDHLSIARFGRELTEDDQLLRDACISVYDQIYHQPTGQSADS